MFLPSQCAPTRLAVTIQPVHGYEMSANKIQPPAAAPAPAVWRNPDYKLFFLSGLLMLITFLAYLPVWRAGFIWDDDSMLTANPLIRLENGLYYFWFTTAANDYFPLTFTSLWVEWRLWGANAMGYHVTNVLLHGLGAVLLWRVLARLKIPGAWWAALLFGLHPVGVASVAWIAERKNTLSLVFYLSSILAYLRIDSALRVTGSGLRVGLRQTTKIRSL